MMEKDKKGNQPEEIKQIKQSQSLLTPYQEKTSKEVENQASNLLNGQTDQPLAFAQTAVSLLDKEEPELMIDITQETKKRNIWYKNKWILLCSGIVVILMMMNWIVISVKNQNRKETLAQIDAQQDTFFSGIVIQGVDVSDKTKEQAIEMLEEKFPNPIFPIEINIMLDQQNYQYTQEDFLLNHTIEQVVEQAFLFGRTGSEDIRVQEYLQLKKNKKHYSLEITTEDIDQSLKNIAKTIAKKYDRPAKNASIQEFKADAGKKWEEMVRVSPAQKGRVVDQQELINQCKKILETENKKGKVTARTEDVSFTINEKQLLENLGSFEAFSTNSTNTKQGNHNMGLALKKINSTVLNPGEKFSFLNSVGPLTVARGFQEAKTILNGEFIDDSGGGVCQASTTLYGAVLRAGLEIVERNNHSRQISYVPIGQDAMVNEGSSDFQFKNNTEYPIMILAYMIGTKLTVQLFGYQHEEWDRIEVNSWKTEEIAPGDPVYKQDDTLPKGEQMIDSQAVTGVKASGRRVYQKNGKTVKQEALYRSSYRAFPAQIRVGTKEIVDQTNLIMDYPPEEEEGP